MEAVAGRSEYIGRDKPIAHLLIHFFKYVTVCLTVYDPCSTIRICHYDNSTDLFIRENTL